MAEGITANQLTTGLIHSYSHSFEISHADIVTLDESYVALGPTGIAGTYYRFKGATLFLDFRFGAYGAVAANISASIEYAAGGGSASNKVAFFKDMLEDGADIYVATLVPYLYVDTDILADPTWVSVDQLKEQGFRFAVSNQAVNLTGGHASNKIYGELEYQVITLPTFPAAP